MQAINEHQNIGAEFVFMYRFMQWVLASFCVSVL